MIRQLAGAEDTGDLLFRLGEQKERELPPSHNGKALGEGLKKLLLSQIRTVWPVYWETLSLPGNREANEDSIRIVESGAVKCFIVADGLGGHGKGDVASRIAADAFAETFQNSEKALPELMSDAFDAAQTRILEEQRKQGCPLQMKTTVCALAVKGDQIQWGHIGDSRLYAFCRGKVKVRTLDHSVPQMLVLAKEIKEKEIRNHPDRNKLLRVLGISDDSPRYELSQVQSLGDFQAFLLCSDGFWELILEKEMGALLKKSRSPGEWLEKMKEIVDQRGRNVNMDNYSAIAIMV